MALGTGMLTQVKIASNLQLLESKFWPCILIVTVKLESIPVLFSMFCCLMMFYDPVDIVSIFSISELLSASVHVSSSCSVSRVCIPELTGLLWITPLLRRISPLCHCCTFNGRELQIAWFFFRRFRLSKTQRNPDLQLVEGSDQPVWSNKHVTLPVNPLSSRFSPQCFYLSCGWLIRRALVHRWTGIMSSVFSRFLLRLGRKIIQRSSERSWIKTIHSYWTIAQHFVIVSFSMGDNLHSILPIFSPLVCEQEGICCTPVLERCSDAVVSTSLPSSGS